MYVYNCILLFCAMSVGLTEGRRVRRSESCRKGVYQHEGKTCCLCQPGYRVVKDCTDTSQTKCELCPDKTYIDHWNSDHQCLPCKVCDSNQNIKVKEQCSRYSNTVCGCEEDYYCDKGDHCKFCRSCDKCEKHGVKEQCTATNNTVCHDSSVPAGGIAAAVTLPLILVVGGVLVMYLRRKKKICFRESKSTDEKEQANLTEVDPDVDLSPHLQDIADVMGWKRVKSFALRSGVTKTTVDNYEINNDVKERTYELLSAWYQKKGLKDAYPDLIKTLDGKMSDKRTADEIRKIVATAQT